MEHSKEAYEVVMVLLVKRRKAFVAKTRRARSAVPIDHASHKRRPMSKPKVSVLSVDTTFVRVHVKHYINRRLFFSRPHVRED